MRATALFALICLLGAANAQTCYPDLPTALQSLGLEHTADLLPIGNLTVPVLDESIPLTLFAPSNDAWVQRAPQLLMDPTDIAKTATRKVVTFILQHHVVEGAAVDYTTPEAQAFPLSTDLSSSPCVRSTPVTVKVTSTSLGLLVQSEGTSALVTKSVTTCGGISSIYVIDDVLNPCCTNMFDINKSPLLKDVFFPTDPNMKQFINFFNGPLFDEATTSWTLPPTLFVPSGKALKAFLTTFNADPLVDNVTRNAVYSALTAMHQSSIPVTKESLLLGEPTVAVPSALDGKLKQPGCDTKITVSLRKPTAQEAATAAPYLGTVSVGEVKANIVKSYKLCKGTTLYVIDDVLVPCDLAKLGPCKKFYDIQSKPLVADAFASKDADVKLFMNYFTKPLFVNDTWTLPATLFMPTSEAVAEFVKSVNANPDLEQGVDEIVGNTTLYHMTNTVITNDTLEAAGGKIIGTTLLFGSSKQECQQEATVGSSASGVAVRAGETTAKVLAQYSLCDNNTVYVIDKVLLPCNLEKFVPCTQFFEVQSGPDLKPLFSATDKNLQTFMNYFNNPLYDPKKKTWVLPDTIFFVKSDALTALLQQRVGTKDFFSETAKKLYAILAFTHTSNTPVSLEAMLDAGTTGLKIRTNLNGTTNECQTTIVAKSAPSAADGNSVQVTVSLGNSTANVLKYWQLCGNKNVYLIDAPLQPCELDPLIKTYTPPKDFGKKKSAAGRTLPAAVAAIGASIAATLFAL